MRTVGSTTLTVAPNARFVRPASLSDPSYDVLGPVGTATYVLPETQNSDIVWPGLSTEGVDYAALPDGADLTLHLAEAPAGARVAFFQGGTFGSGAKIHFDSSTGDGVVHTTESTHMHGNWVFSAPGTYTATVTFLAQPPPARPWPPPRPCASPSVTPPSRRNVINILPHLIKTKPSFSSPIPWKMFASSVTAPSSLIREKSLKKVILKLSLTPISSCLARKESY